MKNPFYMILLIVLCTWFAALDCSKKGDTTAPTEVQQPLLSVDRDSLLFGDTTHVLIFSITNTGTSVLTWGITIVTDNGLPWVRRANPASGSLAAHGRDQVTVEVDRSSLPPGTCCGWIKVTSNAGRDSVRVVMYIPHDFFDDFSHGTGNWTFGGCTYSVANAELTMVSTQYYQAYAYSDTFSTYFDIPWVYKGDMTIVSGSSVETDNGLSLGLDDIGSYAVQNMWLAVRRNSTSRNWIWLWWVPSLASQWLPYDGSCYGTSSHVYTSGQKNSLEMSVGSDEKFTLKANDFTLLENSNAVNDFENLAGIDVTLKVKFLTLRGGTGTTTTWDNITFDSETTLLQARSKAYQPPPVTEDIVNGIFDRMERGEDVTMKTLLAKRLSK
jgi:hypothetical protein